MAYGEFAAVYDRLMADMPYPDWLRFFRACLQRYGLAAETIVDLGCGTGNIAIPLAESGFHVLGIDRSAEMLNVAAQKSGRLSAEAGSREEQGSGRMSAAAAGNPAAQGSGSTSAEAADRPAPGAGKGSVRWLQQDMREWQVPEPVDAVVSFCDCLNYLTDAAQLAETFRRTYEGLKPGGLFLFDLLSPQLMQAYAAEQPFVLNERDVAYIWTCDWEEETETIVHRLTIFAESPDRPQVYRRIDETHIQRAYTPDRIVELLAAAGFDRVELFADFAFRPPEDETERLFFAALR